MASFDTNTAETNQKPSYREIRDFAVHLKVRFGHEAATTADYFAQEHELIGDVLRADVWRTVSASIKANDATHHVGVNKVNAIDQQIRA